MTPSLWYAVVEFVRCEDGPTSVEYAVNIALIIGALISVIQPEGTNAKAKFNKVATTLAS